MSRVLCTLLSFPIFYNYLLWVCSGFWYNGCDVDVEHANSPLASVMMKCPLSFIAASQVSFFISYRLRLIHITAHSLTNPSTDAYGWWLTSFWTSDGHKISSSFSIAPEGDDMEVKHATKNIDSELYELNQNQYGGGYWLRYKFDGGW